MKLSDYLENERVADKEVIEEQNKRNTSDEIGKFYDEMKDMSEGDLLKRLAKEIREQKMRGEFDYENLLATLRNFQGMIPEENYQKMLRILDELQKD